MDTKKLLTYGAVAAGAYIIYTQFIAAKAVAAVAEKIGGSVPIPNVAAAMAEGAGSGVDPRATQMFGPTAGLGSIGGSIFK
jgi:hypothetical protein